VLLPREGIEPPLHLIELLWVMLFARDQWERKDEKLSDMSWGKGQLPVFVSCRKKGCGGILGSGKPSEDGGNPLTKAKGGGCTFRGGRR